MTREAQTTPSGRRRGVTVTTLGRVGGTRYTARCILTDGTRAYIPKPVDTLD